MISKQNHIAMGILEQEDTDSDTAMKVSPNSECPNKAQVTNSNAAGSETSTTCDTSNDKLTETVKTTKLQLSFSVDRLLSRSSTSRCGNDKPVNAEKGHTAALPCCSYFTCLVGNQHEIHHYQLDNQIGPGVDAASGKCKPNATQPEIQSIIRPKAIRPMGGNNCEAPFPTVSTAATLAVFHQHQQQHQHQHQQHQTQYMPPHHSVDHQFHQAMTQRFGASGLTDTPGITNLTLGNQQQHFHQTAAMQLHLPHGTGSSSTNSQTNNSTISSSHPASTAGAGGKRKRSWSRAVFSNLQRKGLEIQFQQQKYITKPDRRKLAARLNLTDAQVKVWFQNRRMKWRHTRENLKSGQEKQVPPPEEKCVAAKAGEQMGYSTDSSSSLCMSDNEEDNEIDVVE